MRRTIGLLGAALALALTATACGGDDDEGSSATTTAAGTAAPGGTGEGSTSGPGTTFPPERCEKNRSAGTINFLTSFDYAAAASIVDVVAAEEQGYFAALCLDVKLQPGFSSANVATVSAGAAQMTSLGSFSEVAVANAQGAGLVAVAVEGHTAIDELLVENDAGITELGQLEGKAIGIKGAIPYSVRAMLAKHGVDESTITQIEVDFNPVVLFETDIVALPAYKSNEPGQLDAKGYAGRYTAFDPQDDDIPGSFAVFTTSKEFATEHPTAVADFVRASLKGFEWAAANPDAAVAASVARTDPSLYLSPEGETFRWKTELALVQSNTPDGEPVGAIDVEGLEAELAMLESLGVVEAGEVDVASSIDTSFMDDITENGKLIWFGG